MLTAVPVRRSCGLTVSPSVTTTLSDLVNRAVGYYSISRARPFSRTVSLTLRRSMSTSKIGAGSRLSHLLPSTMDKRVIVNLPDPPSAADSSWGTGTTIFDRPVGTLTVTFSLFAFHTLWYVKRNGAMPYFVSQIPH